MVFIEKLHLRSLFSGEQLKKKQHFFNTQKPRIVLVSFLESLFLHMSFKFHSNCKIVLITGTMLMCAYTNNY